MRRLTDDQLAAGLRGRDPAALAGAIDAHGSAVYRLVRRILAGAGSEQDVEECASDVFLAAWERVSRYEPARAPFRTWLLMQAKYLALDRRRHLLRQAEPGCGREFHPDPAPDPAAVLTAAAERKRIQHALAQLPPLDRELIYRRYFLGERVDDVAGSLGLTRQAADNRLWRARRALRRYLGPGEEASHHVR